MYFKPFLDIYYSGGFSFSEARSEISFALEILFDYTYKDFLLGKTLEKSQKIKAENIFKERIKSRKPIQQLLSRTFFYGRRFFVNEFTLIPRPETELLVKTVLDAACRFENPKLLDIGTGSGCIGITLLLENKKIKADMSDISMPALKTAEKNAQLYNTLERAEFIHSDLFKNINKKYDIIVSNPPYIPIKDKQTLQIEVRDFDPETALFTSDNDGIEFYEKIINDAPLFLTQGGMLFFELGAGQSRKVKKLLEKAEFHNTAVLKDFSRIERVISGIL